jgi:hypothetical protein
MRLGIDSPSFLGLLLRAPPRGPERPSWTGTPNLLIRRSGRPCPGPLNAHGRARARRPTDTLPNPALASPRGPRAGCHHGWARAGQRPRTCSRQNPGCANAAQALRAARGECTPGCAARSRGANTSANSVTIERSPVQPHSVVPEPFPVGKLHVHLPGPHARVVVITRSPWDFHQLGLSFVAPLRSDASAHGVRGEVFVSH